MYPMVDVEPCRIHIPPEHTCTRAIFAMHVHILRQLSGSNLNNCSYMFITYSCARLSGTFHSHMLWSLRFVGVQVVFTQTCGTGAVRMVYWKEQSRFRRGDDYHRWEGPRSSGLGFQVFTVGNTTFGPFCMHPVSLM